MDDRNDSGSFSFPLVCSHNKQSYFVTRESQHILKFPCLMCPEGMRKCWHGTKMHVRKGFLLPFGEKILVIWMKVMHIANGFIKHEKNSNVENILKRSKQVVCFSAWGTLIDGNSPLPPNPYTPVVFFDSSLSECTYAHLSLPSLFSFFLLSMGFSCLVNKYSST